MLPDFPRIKKKHGEAINKYLRNLMRQDILFSDIREEQQFEGNRMEIKTETGEIDRTEYKQLSTSYNIKREDVITKGPAAFIENIHTMAEEVQKQKAKLFFDKMHEITKKTGNIIDGKGQPFTHEMFLDTLRKIWIEFDDEGKPMMPTMIVSPELGSKIKERLPEWEANSEYKKQFEEVMEQKRKEWNDRESHRKLVN